jgi:hypothetical protein
MPMTRQRAQSSFVVEIKRSSGRTPEVFALNKTSTFRRSSLADQVFSKDLGRPLSAQIDKPKVHAAAQQAPSAALVFAAAPEPQTQPSPRRVLPDLLSIPLDPVAERIRQEADERASRVRATRKERRPKSLATRAVRSVSMPATPVPMQTKADVTAATAPGSQTVQQPVRQDLPAPRRLRNVLTVKAKRAERGGLHMPRLPAGQRWKRRLPTACW